MLRRPPRSTLFPYTTLFRSLFRAPVLGGTPEMIARNVDSNPGVSPDGKSIVFVRANDPEVGKWRLVEVNADRKSTRLNSSHMSISYAVFCLKKKTIKNTYNT